MSKSGILVPRAAQPNPIAVVKDLSPFVLRTSDRMLFKKCRRLWGWMSHLRQGRSVKDIVDYLWFGSGIHYALEDYHGLNLYQHPTRAFYAYVLATKAAGVIPGTWLEHQLLGMSLMTYYADQWLLNREELDTYDVNGIPQVEVNGAVDMGVTTPDGRPIHYGFTLDRLVVDEYGRLWIVEYKTAKQIRLYHFDVDEQITAYCWAAWRLYDMPIAGVVYQQFRKQIPSPPKILATGRVSTDIRQPTSAALYKKTLEDIYGSIDVSPMENISCYNKIASGEDEDKDRFIVRHRIERNQQQLISFEQKIYMELEDITNDDLPLYSNATKDCDYMCPMQAACLAMDDGSDWENILNAYSNPNSDGLTQREKEQARWRNHLPEPSQLELPESQAGYDQLIQQLSKEPSQEEQLTPEQAFLEELDW